MSALDLLFSRLPKPPRKAPARMSISRAYRSECPCCENHGLPLSLAETSDGGLLVHCFAGCEPEAVLHTLGLGWSDVLPPAALGLHLQGNGGPSAWGSLASAVDALHAAHCRLLSKCTPMQADEIEAALHAIFDAGEAMEHVKCMARAALRGGAK